MRGETWKSTKSTHGNFFSWSRKIIAAHQHTDSSGKWEKHETRALIFLCAWGKSREDDAKVFRRELSRCRYFGAEFAYRNSRQRRKLSFTNSSNIILHQKLSFVSEFASSLKHEMELQKFVCVLVCFAAALRPIISSPSHRIIMAPSGCIERSAFASKSDREGECKVSLLRYCEIQREMICFLNRTAEVFLSLQLFPRSRLCEDFPSADLSSARSSRSRVFRLSIHSTFMNYFTKANSQLDWSINGS